MDMSLELRKKIIKNVADRAVELVFKELDKADTELKDKMFSLPPHLILVSALEAMKDIDLKMITLFKDTYPDIWSSLREAGEHICAETLRKNN